MNAAIAALKAELDAVRPLGEVVLARLEAYYDVQLTYTSNAIEGNSLTYGETALVIEKGITVGGKSLRDHLEAVDLYDAITLMRRSAADARAIDEAYVIGLHAKIVARSQPGIAGRYADTRRRVIGSDVVFPNPAKVPALMAAFGKSLAASPPEPTTAFKAHLDLATIHPFTDGNGRTARLVMNTVLLAGGYPPIAIGPPERAAYISAIERAQLTGDHTAHDALLASLLEATLADVIAAIRETIS